MNTHKNKSLLAVLTSALLATFISSVAFGAVGVTVAPSTISNTYVGMVTVQITGLSNGETVQLQKYLDANANGVLDGPDWLLECLSLTDGFVPKIGGVTNYAVPFDLTGTNGAITAQLNFCLPNQLDHFVGRYLFRVTGPSGAATTTFTVTNAPFAQAITGTVKCADTNVPYPLIVFLTPDEELAGGVVGANDGTFTNRLPPGTYITMAVRPGYIFDAANPAIVTLPEGITVSTNLNVIGATRLLAGRVVDAANTNVGLPGVFLFTMSASGAVTLGTTDTNGNFALPVGTGFWTIEPNTLALSRLGYVGLDEKTLPQFYTTHGNVTNALLVVPKANALFYGSVRTFTGVPLAGVWFYGNDAYAEYETDSVTSTNGLYAAGVLGGRTWNFRPEYAGSQILPNYVVSSGTNTYVGSNQAIQLDFVAVPVIGTISGWARDTNGNPAPGLGVYAWANIGTNHFYVYTETGPDGIYLLRVADDTWRVGVNCPQLQQHGYQCPPEQVVSVPPSNATVNFTIYPLAPLEITTVSLPHGHVGYYYNELLRASGGVPPYGWALEVGSGQLPPGLILQNWGQINGTPTATGTFNFTVRVTDNLGNWTNKQLSITIAAPPLIITTTMLPSGQVWINYLVWLNATGGVPPYNWSLAPSSAPLPPGLVLRQDGRLEGVPTTNGTFNFTVRVTDSMSNFTNKTVTLTITPPPSPVPVIESARRLPTGEFQFQFNTLSGAMYTLLYSTNLVHWTPIITFSGLGSPITIIDPNTGAPVRFYRVRVQL